MSSDDGLCQYYWNFELFPSPSIPNPTQHFGKLDCFGPQKKNREALSLVTWRLGVARICQETDKFKSAAILSSGLNVTHSFF
jgi:hypothetical protein